MAKTAALGDGPIAFFTEGVQIEVPLSAIYFDNEVVKTTRTDLPSPAFDNWISFLASRRRLIAGVAPPVAKAIVVTAVEPGASGNDIQFKVTRKSDTTVDISVTETDSYEGLTLAALKSQLGAKGGDFGVKPGLLWFTDPAAAPLAAPVASPVTGTPATPATAPALPTWTIARTTGVAPVAVTLEPRRGGAAAIFDAGDFTVTITNVQPAVSGATFTLTVTWTKKVEDVAVTGIPGTLASLGYLVKVTAPDGALAVTNLPRPGTVKLMGGAERVDAVAAAATVMANE